MNRIFISLGKISYSVYIFHFLVLDFVALTLHQFRIGLTGIPALIVMTSVTAMVSSGIAFLSKRLIEDRGIAFGHKLSQRIVRIDKSAPAFTL